MSIGERIKMRREELGWTQEELAKKMGYKSKSTINKIELGKSDVTQSKVPEYAKVLMTTPAYLLEMDDVEDSQESLYYLNPETVRMAQKIYDNKYLRALFHVSDDASPEVLQTAHDMVVILKKRERGDDY